MRTRSRGIISVSLTLLIIITSFMSVNIFTSATRPSIFEKKELNRGLGGHIQGQILVKFKPDALEDEIDELNLKHGCSKLRKSSNGLYVLKVSPKETVHGMIKKYRGEPIVEYAQVDYICNAFYVPNDPYYSYQWHLPLINMEQAWDIQPGGTPGIVVAVIDTGVAYEDYSERIGGKKKNYYQAQDLSGTIFVPGYDFINNDDHPNDDHSHGTHVTGTIAQTTQNGYGVAGIAFEASIMPVKVLNSYGSGSTEALRNGILWATDNGADVISMSLGFPPDVGPEDIPSVTEAVQYAYGKGVILIAASGNDGVGVVSLPAAYPEVIAVGAIHSGDALASYSQYGSALDVVAPGGDGADRDDNGYIDGVLQQTFNPNTRNTGDFGFWFKTGTSMATPHVSGLVALLLAQGQTRDEVMYTLQTTSVDLGAPGWDEKYGYGRIDSYAALMATLAPDTTSPMIEGVKESDVTSSCATITWTTNEPSDSTVNYGTTTSLGSTTSDVNMVTSHSLTLTGLAGSTEYYYEVSSTDSSGNLAIDNNGGTYYSFKTLMVDTSPPTITGATGSTVSTTGEPVTISATITDNVAVTSADVHYTAIDSTKTSIPMSKDAYSDIWSVYVPIAPNKVGAIPYYITARDRAGNIATDPISGTYSIEVTDNDAPLANAGPDQTVIVGETVQFDGSGSTDNIGIMSYSWDFCDDIIDTTGEAPTHVYSAAGSYIVTLTVTDAASNSGTDTLTVTVTETLPQPTAHTTIDMSREDKIRGRGKVWSRATAKVTILIDGVALKEADVYGSWSGSYGATVSGRTNGEGTVMFRSGWASNGGTLTFTFEVTYVERDGVSYNLAGETSDTI